MFHMYDAACNDVRGFICGDGSDAHIPASYTEFLKHWGALIYKALNSDSILLDAAKLLLYQSNMDGYQLLKQLAQKFHPYMINNIATVMPTRAKQTEFYKYSAFQMTDVYYYLLQGWIYNTRFNFGEINHQDRYIQHLKYEDKIQPLLNAEQASPLDEESNKYIAGQFFATINAINSIIENRHSRSSLFSGRFTPLSQSSLPSHPQSQSSFVQSSPRPPQFPCCIDVLD